MRTNLKDRRAGAFPGLLILLSVLLVILLLIVVGVGRYPLHPFTVLQVLLSKWVPIEPTWPQQAEGVVFTLRLPRALAAVLVGSALSLSGACYQGVFKNPLVAPDVLGVSSGACIGASMGILLGWNASGIQLLAFIGGMVAVGLTTSIPKITRNQSMMMLVLSGIIVGGLMSSIMGFIKYIADPETQLASITYWQMGSLAKVVSPDLVTVAIPILLATGILLLLRWRINVLSLGDREAQSLGVPVLRSRRIVILCATVLTASAVCISGTIGWVGLVIPHFGRMLAGPDNRKLLPLSCLLGGIFLLVIDTCARLMTSAELPLTILTGIVGAPFYVYLLIKQRMKLS
ncbi:FecCD family ABC transporter permease [Desulfosporosinus youngiae]|uniref:ABC-type Fe3+-siderophore transport system, permease component n=1 Tax=Desulfosporosinus youngiae DSM 17734 TaxID=768710 RepID=H5Y3C9_9FIRM|nr:iron ABC transporter permease [Desulfosporosinus youngiae]EHQ88898.1 ABC-type Fe3+-siderophore transport system, permease component [Desulfosporosinus youngiae DSM 17734]